MELLRHNVEVIGYDRASRRHRGSVTLIYRNRDSKPVAASPAETIHMRCALDLPEDVDADRLKSAMLTDAIGNLRALTRLRTGSLRPAGDDPDRTGPVQ
ncbi:hypothetical protein BV394_07985 [Brevirhabdus pacifica]|uniref:Uncharacterized protein n=1 Tax=Brevirhabdus pacifica TaxID=1267768 RepID=A0A1U7DI52_9RHOB|nr:hypothetical protein [Brevirhabdus pacifica]APX89662.1 hypothetical protein BV394_07985 [Brevirhabdus pacifica]OWU74509.1 hypothetical protein ATO5_12635 [Loktanella sp. 22II-4b]PJJ85659.1 hypothetical protein CLV77_0179 [Brevirhabdus pacifica]